MTDTYDDGTIVCGPAGLEIHSYYFPFGTKRVPYAQVQDLHRIEMTGVMSGRWRLWGTGNPRYWANLDWRRFTKSAGFVVDVGTRVSPIITPDDPDTFETVLRGRANLGADGADHPRGPFI